MVTVPAGVTITDYSGSQGGSGERDSAPARREGRDDSRQHHRDCTRIRNPPVDALVTTGHLRPDEIGGERTSIKMALKRASIGEKWDSIAEDIDGMHLIVGRFPRIHELDITAITDHSSEESEGESELERRRKAKSGPTPPVETTAEAGNEAEELDYDALIERINAGTEQVAAQKRTPPLEEHFT